jgi:hypothetical protein
MKNLDDQKLLADIVNRAETGEHTKPSWIRSWSEYKAYQINKRAINMLIDGLEHSAASLFKRHCHEVSAGTADITKLLIRNTLLRTAEFYRLELAIVIDMISEYEAYLLDGNFIGQFLFYETRPWSECWDRRSME